jgi:hypothetical protein
VKQVTCSRKRGSGETGCDGIISPSALVSFAFRVVLGVEFGTHCQRWAQGKSEYVALDMRGMAVVGETELVAEMEAVGGGTRCMCR